MAYFFDKFFLWHSSIHGPTKHSPVVSSQIFKKYVKNTLLFLTRALNITTLALAKCLVFR